MALDCISEFVFGNSWFQISDAFQSLICDGRSAAVVNKSRTCWATTALRLWYRLYFYEINRKRATGNPVMFILLHWYCHRGFGSGKMITFTLKIFNSFGDVYTRDGTISLCQRDASAQIVVSHNYPTKVLGSILFTPSVVTKWYDRHRYLSIHHVPYLMSLSRPRHCSTTLTFRKHSIQIKINVFSSHVTLKSDGWPWKTKGYLFSTTSSCVHQFKPISEFKLELQPGNAQFGSKSVIFMSSVTLKQGCQIKPWFKLFRKK